MLSALNSVTSLIADNALSSTQAALGKTLTELSTGLRINSGADDPAGLSIVNGMHANIAALTQSSQNAVSGIAALQTSDGALANVGLLLQRAVTLATEASNGGLTAAQSTALNTEFQSILFEVNQIGGTTDFNGANVFASAPASFSSTQTSLTTSSGLTAGSVTSIQDSLSGGNFKFKAVSGSTIADLEAAITAAASTGTLSAGTTASIVAGHLVIATTTAGATLQASSNDSTLGGLIPATTGNGLVTVFNSDGDSSSILSTFTAQPSSTGFGLQSSDLNTSTHAATALSAINNAISMNSAARGELGASVNQLTAQMNVDDVEVVNLTSASNSIEDADLGKTVARMTELTVLQQTAMAAMSQSNQSQKALLQLLQSLG